MRTDVLSADDAPYLCARTRIGEHATALTDPDGTRLLAVRASWLDATDAPWLAVTAGHDASLLAPTAALRAGLLRRTHHGVWRCVPLGEVDFDGKAAAILRMMRRLRVIDGFRLGRRYESEFEHVRRES